MPALNAKGLVEERIRQIGDFHLHAGVRRAEIDVSGGIDSAVMLVLVAEAIGPDNVTAVYQGINSSKASLDRARMMAEATGVRLIECDWSDIIVLIQQKMLGALEEAGWGADEVIERMQQDPTILGSLRSTFRAPMGRFANRCLWNGIRHGTGNGCEDDWLRFFQKGGDGEVDTSFLSLFAKGEVYQMARVLPRFPREVLVQRPTADLWADNEAQQGQSDESEIKRFLGLPTEFHEPVYSYIDPDTGAYKNVGLIERVSRFCDLPVRSGGFVGMAPTMRDVLFADAEPDMPRLLAAAEASGLFADLPGRVSTLLLAARKAERVTRHKYNPALPTLGTRTHLIDKGLLTNELPVVKAEQVAAGA